MRSVTGPPPGKPHCIIGGPEPMCEPTAPARATGERGPGPSTAGGVDNRKLDDKLTHPGSAQQRGRHDPESPAWGTVPRYSASPGR